MNSISSYLIRILQKNLASATGRSKTVTESICDSKTTSLVGKLSVGEVLEGKVQAKTRELTFIGTDKGVLKAKGAMDIPVGARIRLKVVTPGYPARVKVESWKIDARQSSSRIQGLMAKSLSNLSRLSFIAQEISQSEVFSFHANSGHGEQMFEKPFLTLLRPFEIGVDSEKRLMEAVRLSPAFSRLFKGILSRDVQNSQITDVQGENLEEEKVYKDSLMFDMARDSTVVKGETTGKAKQAVQGPGYQRTGGDMAVSDNKKKTISPETKGQKTKADVLIEDVEKGMKSQKEDSASLASSQNATAKSIFSKSVARSPKMQANSQPYQRRVTGSQTMSGEQDLTPVDQEEVLLSDGMPTKRSHYISQNDLKKTAIIVSKGRDGIPSLHVDEDHVRRDSLLTKVNQGKNLLKEEFGDSGDREVKRTDIHLTDKGYSRPSDTAERQEKIARSIQLSEENSLGHKSYGVATHKHENAHFFLKGFATQLEIAQDIQAHFLHKGLDLVVIPFLFQQFQGVGQWIYWQEKDPLTDEDKKGTLSHLVFDLSLNNLGKLNIHLLKNRDILSIYIWGEKEKVPFVREGMLDLANDLKSAGFKIGNLEVSVAGENGAGLPDETVSVIDVQGFHVIT